jgi:hypothetical protein
MFPPRKVLTPGSCAEIFRIISRFHVKIKRFILICRAPIRHPHAKSPWGKHVREN